MATGFLVCGPWDEVGHEQQGAVSRRRVREEELEDIISAVSQTFLGLTLNCARCHNHKFDPIPQRDYYRVKAALEGVRPGDRPLMDPDIAKQREQRSARLRDLEKDIAGVEQIGRAAVLGKKGRSATEGVPKPMARWTFETDARDDIGSMHGTLHGGATIVNGRLRLDGKGSFLSTAPPPHDLREKTLEAWVALPTLDQRGGGVLSVEMKAGGVFDAIVFGEREPRKWMAGSDFFNRTRDLTAAAESAKPADLVHVAIVYGADSNITVYRNGDPYADTYKPAGTNSTLRTYPADDSARADRFAPYRSGQRLFDRRSRGGALYDRALSAAEVAASFRAGVIDVPLADLLKALTPEQQQKRERLLAELAKERAAVAMMPPPLGFAYAANATKPEPTFVLRRGDVEKPEEEVSAGGLSAIKSPNPEFGLTTTRRRASAAANWPTGSPLPTIRSRRGSWSTVCGSTTSAAASWPRPATSATTAIDRHIRNCSIGSPKSWCVPAGRSSTCIGSSCCRRRIANRRGPDPQAAAIDADNRLLWRYPARRLEAEAVRDVMLSVSGQLNPRRGGPSYRPFTIKVFNSTFYDLLEETTPEMQRRTVYRMSVDSAKNPVLDALDCPDPSVKAPRRAVTTTPLQALELMNNSFVLWQARSFAEALREKPATIRRRG